MLFPVEQAFVGRDEKRAPLKTPAWEASPTQAETPCMIQTITTLFIGQIPDFH